MTLTPTKFSQGIQALMQHWSKCVKHNGDYSEDTCIVSSSFVKFKVFCFHFNELCILSDSLWQCKTCHNIQTVEPMTLVTHLCVWWFSPCKSVHSRCFWVFTFLQQKTDRLKKRISQWRLNWLSS